MRKQRLKAHPNTRTSGLYDPKFKYTPSTQTDILKTFVKMGWTPPSLARMQSLVDAGHFGR